MVDFGPLKQNWRDVAEKKAKLKGLRGKVKEGIGVNMIEHFAKNLEEQTKVKMGQGKEEKGIVKLGMQKIINDVQRQVRLQERDQKRLRQSLKEQLGSGSARFKRTITALNKEAQKASEAEAKRFDTKTVHLSERHSEGLEQRARREEDRPILAMGKFLEYSELFIYQPIEVNSELERELYK